MAQNPINILEQGGSEEKGENAQLSSFVAAIAIGDLVKTTLGPKGMDKILQASDGKSITVTNDGATILKAIHLDNPAAKVLVEIAKAQDDEVGDGTTSVTVLASEFLREAEKLVNQKLHPQTIIEGWRLAVNTAKEALTQSARQSDNPEAFRNDLLKIARTTLSSKLVHQEKEHFAQLCVDAVLRLKGSTDLENIQIIKKIGGSLKDSFLDPGFILEKKIGVGCPKRLENPKILIANTPMDTDKIKIFGAKVKVEETAAVAEIEESEKKKMLEKCKKIVDHKINCFINRQLIYNLPEQYFASHGVMSIEHADFQGIEQLALATGAEIVSTFDHPELVKLGTCQLIEEIMIGEDTAIRFSGVPKGEACTIILRGATQQMLDEAERSVHDALAVLSQMSNEKRTVLGGGASELLMAKAVEDLAKVTPGKKALAIEGFARALRTLPTYIADNGGFDSSDLVTRLRAEHNRGNHKAALDMKNGDVGDAEAMGLVESYKAKLSVLLTAEEAAEMLLRVDVIVRAPPRPRDEDNRPC